MGSRIGFRFKQGITKSQILRQQWRCDIQEAVTKTWDTLGGEHVSQGSFALRDDLDIGRAFACFVYCNYQAPFNSIEKDSDCDIVDNGLIEINIDDYKHWDIFHIEIGNWNELSRTFKDFCKDSGKYQEKIKWHGEYKKTKIAEMTPDGFKWVLNEKMLGELGEGLK